ncbi:MAG: YncE family protein, partial [Nitrososphaerales archaeon]
GSAYKLLDTLEISDPCGIALDSERNIVYVTSESDDSVYVIDGSTNTIVNEIQVSKGPRGVAVNPITNTIYVANSASDSMSVIDGSTNTVLTTVTIGKSPLRIAVNQVTNIINVISDATDSLYMIDGSTNSILDSIEINNPYEVAVNTNMDLVYVTNRSDAFFVIETEEVSSMLPLSFVIIMIGVAAALAAGITAAVLVRRKKAQLS